MSAEPTWESVDNYTSDLLSLVATEQTPPVDREWQHYVDALATVASRHAGLIPPNELRVLVRGNVAPKRIGAFMHRALSQGLIRRTGEWEVSNDRDGKNIGRPMPCVEWIGGAA